MASNFLTSLWIIASDSCQNLMMVESSQLTSNFDSRNIFSPCFDNIIFLLILEGRDTFMDDVSDGIDQRVDDGLELFLFLLNLSLLEFINLFELELLRAGVVLICFFLILDCLSNLVPFFAEHVELIPN